MNADARERNASDQGAGPDPGPDRGTSDPDPGPDPGPASDVESTVAAVTDGEENGRLARIAEWIRGSHYPMLGLGTASALESTVIPIPVEVLLIPMMLADRDRIVQYGLAATFGSLVGGLLGYWAGWALMDTVGQWALATFGWSADYAEFQAFFDDNGFWAVAFVGVSPVPFQVALLTAGATGYSLILFALAVILGRGVRYALVGGLIYKYGTHAVALWRHNRLYASLALGAAVLVLWGLFEGLGMAIGA